MKTEKTKTSTKDTKKKTIKSIKSEPNKPTKVVDSRVKLMEQTTKKAPSSKRKSKKIERVLASKKVERKVLNILNDKAAQTQLYVSLEFGDSLYRLLATKDNKYFINLDNEYILTDLTDKTVYTFGNYLASKINSVEDIPWEV